jgi:hypothetical protein
MQGGLIETIHILIDTVLLDYKDLSTKLQNCVQVMRAQLIETLTAPNYSILHRFKPLPAIFSQRLF